MVRGGGGGVVLTGCWSGSTGGAPGWDLKVLQCSKTINSHSASSFVCLRAWTGPDRKGAGFGSTKGGVPPPPPYSPPNCRTPLGVTHWLVAAPVSRSY